jgi:Fungal protein kinase
MLAGLSLFDRAGALHSKLFDINDYPSDFIRLVVGLSSCSNTLLGYDPTITSEAEGRFIHVNNTRYKILETEFIGDMIRGRGTVCYRVSWEGQEYAIKDVWADMSRTHTEVEFLKAAGNIKGVPTYIDHMTVRIDSEDRDDLTSWVRSHIPSTYYRYEKIKKVEVRQHQRVVMHPFASPLMQFKSKVEFLSVLRDVIHSMCLSYSRSSCTDRA